MSQLVRQTPRISINQLANYLVSTPAQRSRIVRNQKRPPTYLVNWYEFANNCISDFILGGCTDENILIAEIDRLYALVEAGAPEDTRCRTNAEALESFCNSYDQLDFDGLSLERGHADPPKLIISDVEISVRPEFIIRGQHRQQEVCGGLKFYFSKEDRLSDRSAPYITAVVMRYIQDYIASGATVSRAAHCRVFDVFAGEVYLAPSAIINRFRDIETACREIALWWSVV